MRFFHQKQLNQRPMSGRTPLDMGLALPETMCYNTYVSADAAKGRACGFSAMTGG